MSNQLRAKYDRVAENYTRQFRDEMDKKPFDRKMLEWLAEKVDGSRSSLVTALQELRRVLRPNGVLLLAFHVGTETKHVEGFLDTDVSMDFFFFGTEEVKDYLRTAGYELEEVIERDPYPEQVEYQSRRAYIFARKP